MGTAQNVPNLKTSNLKNDTVIVKNNYQLGHYVHI